MIQSEKATEEIVNQLKHGLDRDENSRLLFRRYHGWIYRFFRSKGISPEECEELTEDVFVSVYTHLNELRQDTKFENWVCRIAMNVYRNERERRAARKRAATVVSLTGDLDDPADLQLPASATANPEVEMLEKEKLDQVRQALHELPPQMRSCLLLRVDDELSYREIAAVMGISINTVSAHLHQARKLIEEKLSRYFVEYGRLSVEEER
jgi:RNA polymerase sigma-70 factor (ECF subfamily)